VNKPKLTGYVIHTVVFLFVAFSSASADSWNEDTNGVVYTNGNVGIGCIGHGHAFEINKYNTSTTAHIYFGNPSATSGSPSAVMTFAGDGIQNAGFTWIPASDHVSGQLNLSFGGSNNPANHTPRVTFQADGKVGFGTTEPLDNLHIVSDSGDAAIILQHPYETLRMDQNSIRTITNSNIYIGANGGTNGWTTFSTSGNVGIGTTNPQYKSDIRVYSEAVGLRLHRRDALINDPIGIGFSMRCDSINPVDDTRAGIFYQYNGNLFLAAKSAIDIGDEPLTYSRLFINGETGNVGIGTTTPDPDYKLDVNGTIKAREIKITIASVDEVKVNDAQWSDFVFEDSYKLPSLDHVENYIKENKHLPDVPSAEQIAQDGLSMSGMMAKQMQKIEELTLYVIELKKQNERLAEVSEELKKENESLKTQAAKMSELEARINAIEGK